MSTPVQPNDPHAEDPFAKGSGAGSGNPYSAGAPAEYGQGGQAGNPPGYSGQGYPGQTGQPGGGYPTQAPYQGAAGYPGSYPGGAVLPTEPVPPKTVNWAFWCWILTTVASLVGLIFTLTSSVWDEAVQAGVNQNSTFNGQQVNIDVNTLVTTVKIISVVSFLIFAAVYLLFAFKMRAGRNWARIVLTVFGALTLLSSVSRTASSVTFNGQTYATTSGPGWVTAVLALVGIILMYVGQSNKYFADSKAFRQAPR